ncbi:TPA: hypothetical protein ACX6SV_004021 [Photobacterium damselae]
MMSPETIELLKSLVSAIAGSGLTLAVIAKFGQGWFFKKIDSNYASELAEKNNQLMGELESKKNELNKLLQIEVTHIKSELDVLGSQQSKFLDMKVTSILTLNQQHYLAVKEIKALTDITHMWIEEAALYFKFQIDERRNEGLSDYSVYRKMHQQRWQKFDTAANAAFNKYAECLALNMTILPKSLVSEEMQLVDLCKTLLSDASMNFSRAMNFSEYIMNPENCDGMEEEFMTELNNEHEKAIAHKQYIDQLSDDLFSKSQRSRVLIDSLLSHRSDG